MVKGPGRETSGFELQYVDVAGFWLTLLERGDEVHLIPSDTGSHGQPCVVFSRPEGRSFMVMLRPTRASANPDLYTDIPPWEGEYTLAYMEMLERKRRAGNGESPCYRATQRVGGVSEVVVQVQSRRRRNGWWVYVSVTQKREDGTRN